MDSIWSAQIEASLKLLSIKIVVMDVVEIVKIRNGLNQELLELRIMYFSRKINLPLDLTVLMQIQIS